MNLNNMNQVGDSSYDGEFLATVVDNKDPLERQRVRVTIKGLIEGDTDTLPWIGLVINSAFGMTPTAKTVSVPEIGSKIKVYFQNGDIHYGLSAGYLDASDTATVPELSQNYPNRRGWKDPSGNLFYIDTTSGSNTLLFLHASGTRIDIANDGAVTVTSPVQVTVNAPTATVNANATVNGSTVLNGNLTLNGNFASNGSMTNNSVNVGSTHVHRGVWSGPDNTGTPL